MSHLEEHTTIKYLLSLDKSELKAISTQNKLITKSENILLISFDINYNNHEGHISINYDNTKKVYGEITLDIEFDRPAGEYNYPDLIKLADKYIEISQHNYTE